MIQKTGNFDVDVQSGYYIQEEDDANRIRKMRRKSDPQLILFEDSIGKTTFNDDLKKYLLDSGVPPQYINGVVEFCEWNSDSSFKQIKDMADQFVELIFKRGI